MLTGERETDSVPRLELRQDHDERESGALREQCKLTLLSILRQLVVDQKLTERCSNLRSAAQLVSPSLFLFIRTKIFIDIFFIIRKDEGMSSNVNGRERDRFCAEVRTAARS